MFLNMITSEILEQIDFLIEKPNESVIQIRIRR